MHAEKNWFEFPGVVKLSDKNGPIGPSRMYIKIFGMENANFLESDGEM